MDTPDWVQNRTQFNPLNFEQVRVEGDRKVTRSILDNQLTINMAKELCMIQRGDIGRRVRQYFLQVEAAWVSPDAVMARALQFANDGLALLTRQNTELTGTVAVQNQQIAEMRPKASHEERGEEDE